MGNEKIIIFPGSQLEYEKYVGYEVEVVKSNSNNRGIFLNKDSATPLGRKILEMNIPVKDIEAIVNAVPFFVPYKGCIGRGNIDYRITC